MAAAVGGAAFTNYSPALALADEAQSGPDGGGNVAPRDETSGGGEGGSSAGAEEESEKSDGKSPPPPPPPPAALKNEFSLAMVDAEKQQARRAATKPLFAEDFYFKFGKVPPPTIGFTPPGGMPFSPVKRRYEGYKKFAPRLTAGVTQYRSELGAAVASGSWGQVIALVRKPEKTGGGGGGGGSGGGSGSDVAVLPLVMGLAANTLVQSENEGTTNANFLCRSLANEVQYALDELRAAAERGDSAAAKRSWLVGREYVDAYVSFVNPVILPERVGEPLPFVLIGRRLHDDDDDDEGEDAAPQSSDATAFSPVQPPNGGATAAAAASAPSSSSSATTPREPEACRVAGRYLDCLAARAAQEQQGG